MGIWKGTVESMGLSEFYCGKRVLITGHTGFKGSWISEILIGMGARVCGIALEPNTDPSLFNILNLKARMDSHILDIRDYEAVSCVFAEFQPEIVIHLAAQPLVIDSYHEPRYTYDVNVMGTVNVCECVRNISSVHSFINVTTDKVYENLEKEGYAYQENDRLNGFDPYSNSKSCSELVTQSYMKSFFTDQNIAVSTCRAGNVIGGGDFSANRIAVDCVKDTLASKAIMVRNPNSVRPYQHVLEADVFYLMLAMKQYEDHSLAGHYNIGPNDEDCITTGELVQLFCKKWGTGASAEIADYHGPHEANFLKLNSSKARNTFTWSPRWHVDHAIQKVVEWSKAYRDGYNMTEITDQQIQDYLKG